MSDLHARLLAAIEDEERTARAATAGDWKLWGMGLLADQDGTSNADTAVPVADTYSEPGHPLRTWNALHMQRQQPRIVLARLAAERRVLARHAESGPEGGCAWDDVPDQGWVEHWPCPDVRDLAARLGVEP